MAFWSDERRKRSPEIVPHTSNVVMPLVIAACIIWPPVAALLFPASIVLDVVAIADSAYWVFVWQERKFRVFEGLAKEPAAISLVLFGNAGHAGLIVLCALRGDFTVGVWWALLASAAFVSLSAALVILRSPYAYALAPREMLLAAMVGVAASAGPIAVAYD